MKKRVVSPLLFAKLEKYIQQTQQAYDEALARAHTAEERRDEILSRKIMLWEVDCAKKYYLTSSALTMIARLNPGQGLGLIEQVPGTGLWLVLDNPEMTNLYFTSIPLVH